MSKGFTEIKFPGRWTNSGYSVKPEDIVSYIKKAQAERDRLARTGRSLLRFFESASSASNRMMSLSLAEEQIHNANKTALFAADYFLPQWQQQAKIEAEQDGTTINL